jgi:hypothetical protein
VGGWGKDEREKKFEALSADTLAKLLDTSKEEVGQTLYDLHSLLEVPESQEHPM